MPDESRAKRLFSELEWRWSLAQLLWGVPTAIASFALPAWAISATAALARFAPASWVAAGFAGLLATSVSYKLITGAFARRIRTKYDAKMLASGGAIDALEKTFERKRIYLNEFFLPSHPFIEDKTFIDCEIIGPANLLFASGNRISEGKLPICDAVWLREGVFPNSAYIFQNCIFRGCNFTRVTFFLPNIETEMFRNYSLVRWITLSPYDRQSEPDASSVPDAIPAIIDHREP